MSTIVHFGLCDLAYCGYVLSGLADVAQERGLTLKTELRVPGWLRKAAAGHEHMQMIPVFELHDGDTTSRFCVDAHDKAYVVQPSLLAAVDVYFKVNYQPGAIDDLDLSDADRAKIVPLRTPFMPITTDGWSLRPRLQPSTSMGWGPRDAARRSRQLREFPDMNRIHELRSVPKERDLLFIMRIYSQPHHAPVNEFRYEVASRLAANPDIDATVGLIGHLEGKFAELAAEQVAPQEHLRRLASSRLGVYVLGTHDCLSFKFCELLALGLPIVGQSLLQDTDFFYSLPGLVEQFRYDEPDELVKAIEVTLNNPAEYEATAASNRQLYDDILSPISSADRILDRVLAANVS